MPILAREPHVYPEGLLERPELGFEADRLWWALHTLPRQEKVLMRRLGARKIPFYTPLIERRSRSKTGRVRTAYVPLFPGYVFLYGDDRDRHDAVTTNCVIRWLGVPDQAELTSDLRQINHLIDSGAPLDAADRIVSGASVRITHGALAGLEGKLIRRGPRFTFVIEVHFLQRGASVEIEQWMVEPVAAEWSHEHRTECARAT